MTGTQRWLDSGQTSPEALELLKAARPPSALDAATRARSRRRVAALTVLPVAAGVTFWFKSVALGAILGSAVTVAIVVPHWSDKSQSSPARAAVKTAPEHKSTSAAPAAPSVTETFVERQNPTPPKESSSRPSTTTVTMGKAVPAASASFNDDLSREIQLLERARQLLPVDPNRALSTLHEHQKEFGNGTLVLERQFLEIEALVRLGQRDAARARAAALRARAPGSLYERRLAQLLGDELE